MHLCSNELTIGPMSFQPIQLSQPYKKK